MSAVVAGGVTARADAEQDVVPANENAAQNVRKYKVGEPCLQAPSDTSMGVCWVVSHLTNGFVEYGERKDLSDAKTAVCEGPPGITGFDELAVRVRLTGLKPSTKYYYRAVSQQIIYNGNYNRDFGEKVVGAVHSFETLGVSQRGHFCVINDTHEEWTQFRMAIDRIETLRPAAVVWNGDASNSSETAGTAARIFLRPTGSEDFAVNVPYLWVNGNHDFRGIWNRRLNRFVMTRLPSERSSRDWALTRNFAVRLGDIAMVGLDTGEDKPDSHPAFRGLVAAEEYRRAQALWLSDALERQEIKAAPFVVVFLHIPIFDADPASHPGDVADNGGGRYRTDYAEWQKQCHDLWAPLLERHGVQLVVAAHQHQYRYDAPDSGRCWAQIVGGGPGTSEVRFPTVIEGKAQDGKLAVTVHDVFNKRVVGAFEYSPRRGLPC